MADEDEVSKETPSYLSAGWAVMGLRDSRWKEMFRIYQEANGEQPPTDNG